MLEMGDGTRASPPRRHRGRPARAGGRRGGARGAGSSSLEARRRLRLLPRPRTRGLTAGIIYSPEEVFDDPHFLARGWPADGGAPRARPHHHLPGSAVPVHRDAVGHQPPGPAARRAPGPRRLRARQGEVAERPTANRSTLHGSLADREDDRVRRDQVAMRRFHLRRRRRPTLRATSRAPTAPARRAGQRPSMSVADSPVTDSVRSACRNRRRRPRCRQARRRRPLRSRESSIGSRRMAPSGATWSMPHAIVSSQRIGDIGVGCGAHGEDPSHGRRCRAIGQAQEVVPPIRGVHDESPVARQAAGGDGHWQVDRTQHRPS